MEFAKNDRNQVRRIPNRGHYDADTIHNILDAESLCHVGFVVDGQPFVIPTLYGREDDKLYLHGSAASRMLNNLAGGIPVCLTVTIVDGLVLARSTFHHSINYRSAVVFGTAVEVTGAEKERGLFVISEQVVKGRWSEVRAPNDRELKATSVLCMTMESASAKIRTGPPIDEEEDYTLPVWAGVVPIRNHYDAPVPDSKLDENIAVPGSVSALLRNQCE